ncbi:hypothetical protein [Burkholderia sp. 9779_493]|uniref:hypothetical protein n=1 Tax=Burkholderia sp. 9779_493 TaxID=2751184 RepID=UPI0018C3A9F9|nr:hypothetical protein [Burkholderia sp. 9779_493]MBG0865458.1 hypothetical protein [Burkholderia sp. 9779_493]
MSKIHPMKAVSIADIETAIARGIETATGAAVSVSISSLSIDDASAFASLTGQMPSATLNVSVTPVAPKHEEGLF